jgi:hypothetical protein
MVVVDPDPDDPKWIIASVMLASDVRPAELDLASRYAARQQTIDWGRPAPCHDVTLPPVHDALVWRVDERRRQ